MNAPPTPVPTNSAPTPATPAPNAEAAPVESTKKLGITIATKAVDAIRRQLVKRGTPEASLRVGIRGGGCSGFSYVIEFHDGAPRAKDHVFDCKDSEGNDVRVVCDPKSLVYLNGSVLDWEQTLMRQGFKFVNPQEKTSCGCGHSFTV
ncbi:MAG: iron-sulfur cluster assembly accessory protein [Polyangiaceae bacterium]